MDITKKTSDASVMRSNCARVRSVHNEGEKALIVVAMLIVQIGDYYTAIDNDEWFRERVSDGRRMELRLQQMDVRRQFARLIGGAGASFDYFERVVAEGVDELEAYATNLTDEIRRAQAARVRFDAMDTFVRFVMLSMASMQADALSRGIGLKLTKLGEWIVLLDRMLSSIVGAMRLVPMSDGSTDAVRFYERKFACKQLEVAAKILAKPVLAISNVSNE